MSASVKGLGHLGIFVRDLEVMKDFWGNFMGMTLTKSSEGAAFFSADPESCDHEIALMRGRTSMEDPHLIQQISLRVDSLDDVRDFYRRIKASGYEMDHLVTHGSAIGCYFRDPEGNPVEVFWLTGLQSWAVISIPIDIERSDEAVMADVRRVWEVSRKVDMGVIPDDALKAAIRDLQTAAAPVS